MKYRPKIGPGDFDTKTRQVAKFLDEGHKVKITIMFRGREVFHPELGKKILDRIAEQIEGDRQGRVRAPARRAEHGHGARPGQAGEAVGSRQARGRGGREEPTAVGTANGAEAASASEARRGRSGLTADERRVRCRR